MHFLQADTGQGCVDRPEALFLPQMHPVVQHIGLFGVDRQAARQVIRGLGKFLARFQHPPQVVERHHDKACALGRGHADILFHPLPFLNRLVEQSLALIEHAQIQARLDKAGVDLYGLAVGRFGTTQLAGIGQRQSTVEMAGIGKGR